MGFVGSSVGFRFLVGFCLLSLVSCSNSPSVIQNEDDADDSVGDDDSGGGADDDAADDTAGDDSDDDSDAGLAGGALEVVCADVAEEAASSLRCEGGKCFFVDQGEEGVGQIGACSIEDGTVSYPIRGLCSPGEVSINQTRGCFTPSSLDCADWETIYCFDLSDTSETVTPEAIAQGYGTPVIQVDDNFLYHSISSSPSGEIYRVDWTTREQGVVCSGMNLPSDIHVGSSFVAFSYGENNHDQLGACLLGEGTPFLPLGQKGSDWWRYVVGETAVYAIECVTDSPVKIWTIPFDVGQVRQVGEMTGQCGNGLVLAGEWLYFVQRTTDDSGLMELWKITTSRDSIQPVLSYDTLRAAGYMGIEVYYVLGDYIYVIVVKTDGETYDIIRAVK